MSLRKQLPSIILDPTHPNDRDNINLFLEQHHKPATDFTKSLKTMLIDKENKETSTMIARLTNGLVRYKDRYLVVTEINENNLASRSTYRILGKLKPDLQNQNWIYKAKNGIEDVINDRDNNDRPNFWHLFKNNIEGKTLTKILMKDQALAITLTTKDRLQIARALLIATNEQVHQKGLIHRNLTPDHIKLRYDKDSQDWQAMIINYRSCKKVDDDDTGQPYDVDLSFIAPERLRHQRTTEKTDMFPIALMFGELFGLERFTNRIASMDHIDQEHIDAYFREKFLFDDLFKGQYKINIADQTAKEEFEDELIDCLIQMSRLLHLPEGDYPFSEAIKKITTLIETPEFNHQNHLTISNSAR